MPKKSLAVLLVVGLVCAVAAPAMAGKKKKKKPPAPVAATLYLHDDTPIGDGVNLVQNAAGEGFMPMDATKPDGAVPKSQFITNYGAGPNDMCAGNTLFPVWQGKVTGTMTGDMKLTFTSWSTPGPIVVRVWADVNELACNDAYPTPVREVRLDLAPGQAKNEVVLPGEDFESVGFLMVQISPVLPLDGGTPFLGRVLYDAVGYESALEFSCLPAAGAASCVTE